MKIKWVDGLREVPGVGLVETGKEYDVTNETGKNLIKQGQAKPVKEEVKEVKNEEGRK